MKPWQLRDVTPAWADFMDYQLAENSALAEAIPGIANQLEARGNEAYCTTPMSHVLAVPAGGRSARFFPDSLELIAERAARAERMPSVAVSINFRPDDDPGVELAEQNITAVKEMQRANPTLSLSYAVIQNPPYMEIPKPIGTIRDEIIAGSLQLHWQRSAAAGKHMTDLLITGMDADARDANSDYFGIQQQRYDRAESRGWLQHAITQHERVDPAFVGANALLEWYDLEPMAVGGSNPANFAVNSGLYLAAKGFRRESFAELGTMVMNAHEALGDKLVEEAANGQVVTTSVHDLASRMAICGNLEYGKKWSEGIDESQIYVMREDVPVGYFNNRLGSLVSRVFNAISIPGWQALYAQGVPYPQARAESAKSAIQYVHAAAERIGRPYDSEQIIDKMTNIFRDQNKVPASS